jgi:cytochrome c oxidase subunit 3
VAVVETAAEPNVETVRRPSLLGVGTVVWLSSELMFFAALFGAWFTLRAAAAEWPPEGAELETLRTGLATVVLISSSFTMHKAVQAADASDRRLAIRWLLVTAGLGTIFLANQVLEYTELPFSISSDAYGSMFYLLTGFHGLHVIGGIGFMLATIAAIAGSSRAPSGPTVTVCAYYWHFVDAVWVAMFATIYLLR